jgi:hypothetical protein
MKGFTMKKIALTALKPFVYAGRRLKAGQEFAARGESDARVLIAVKNAGYAPVPIKDDATTAPAVESKPPVAPAQAPAKVVPAVEAPIPAEKPAESQQKGKRKQPQVAALLGGLKRV